MNLCLNLFYKPNKSNNMKQTVAIITEDIVFTKLVEPLLTRQYQNLDVITCQSDEDVSEMLSSSNVRLVLLDGNLKSMSCFEIIQQLSRKAFLNYRLWFFPAIKNKAEIYRSQAMGVNRIITKPYNRFELSEDIESLLTLSLNIL